MTLECYDWATESNVPDRHHTWSPRDAPGVFLHREASREEYLNKRSTIYYITTSIVTQFKGYGDKRSQFSQSFHLLRTYCGCSAVADPQVLCRVHSEIDVGNPAASLMRLVSNNRMNYSPPFLSFAQTPKSSTVTYRCCRSTLKPDIRILNPDAPTSKTQSTT